MNSSLPSVHRVDERLGAISGPQALVSELGDVPHKLVHDLGKLDGVGGWAGAGATGGAGTGRVSDVALVVGRIQVLAIPASIEDISNFLTLMLGRNHSRWEDDGLTDHLALGVRGDFDSVATSAGSSSNEGVLVG